MNTKELLTLNNHTTIGQVLDVSKVLKQLYTDFPDLCQKRNAHTPLAVRSCFDEIHNRWKAVCRKAHLDEVESKTFLRGIPFANKLGTFLIYIEQLKKAAVCDVYGKKTNMSFSKEYTFNPNDFFHEVAKYV